MILAIRPWISMINRIRIVTIQKHFSMQEGEGKHLKHCRVVASIVAALVGARGLVEVVQS